MPKPTTTDENEPDPAAGSPDAAAGSSGAPDAAAASGAKWVLPPNFRDVTAERMGERIALVGPPQRAKPKG